MNRILCVLIVGMLLVIGCNPDAISKDKPPSSWENRYYTEYKEMEGMTYVVYFKQYSGSDPGDGAIAVVNLTKDKLEVELLNKQLKEKD